MNRRAVSKPVQMCVVSVNYHHLLIPADKGMKLVELLQHACVVEHHYSTRVDQWSLREQPDVHLTLIKPGQVVAAQHAPAPEEQRKLLGGP